VTVIDPAEVARAHRQHQAGQRLLFRLAFAGVLFALVLAAFYAFDLYESEDAIYVLAIPIGLLIWVFRKRPEDAPEPEAEPKL